MTEPRSLSSRVIFHPEALVKFYECGNHQSAIAAYLLGVLRNCAFQDAPLVESVGETPRISQITIIESDIYARLLVNFADDGRLFVLTVAGGADPCEIDTALVRHVGLMACGQTAIDNLTSLHDMPGSVLVEALTQSHRIAAFLRIHSQAFIGSECPDETFWQMAETARKGTALKQAESDAILSALGAIGGFAESTDVVFNFKSHQIRVAIPIA